MNPPPESEPIQPRRDGRQALAWLAVVLGVALLVRLTHIDSFPSLDEIWHLGLTAGNGSTMSQFRPDTVYVDPPGWSRLEDAKPFWHVWAGMDGVLHPPLYCLTLRIWRNVWGISDYAAHLYSVVWSLVSITLLFDAARRAMNLGVATLVGLAIACSQTQVYFAQEIRSYQMMIAIASFALWLMTRVELEGVTRRRAVTLAWLTLPLLLTHYFATGGALAIAVWGVLRLQTERRGFVVHLAVAGLVYLACWVPFAVQQIDDLHTGDAFAAVELPSGGGFVAKLLCAPIRPLIDRNDVVSPLFMLAGVLLIVPWLRFRRFAPLLPWGIFLCVGLLPIVALDLARGTKLIDFIRYFSIISPATFLLIAGCAWTFHRRLAYGLTSAAIFAGTYYALARVPTIADCPNLREQTALLQSRLLPGEALVIYPGEGPEALGEMILMTAAHTPGLLDRPVISLHAPMTPEARSQLPRRGWLFTYNLPRPLGEIVSGATDLPDSFRDVFQYVHLDLDPPEPPANQPAPAR